MTLQQLMTQKIDEFSGIEQLSLELEKFRSFSNEKKYFNNIIIYFNGLYNQIVDVENHAVSYRQATLESIQFLEKFNETRNEPTINFLIDLINFKLEYVQDIKRIS